MNGHWGDTVLMLAEAAVQRGLEVMVIGPRPAAEVVHDSLTEVGVPVLSSNAIGLISTHLNAVGSWLSRREVRRRERGDNEGATDLWLLRILIDEVVSLRTARRLGNPGARVVLLTGSSSFIGLAAALSRCPHVRVVHDVHIPAGRRAARVAGLEFLKPRVSLVCPTTGVADELSRLQRYIDVRVRPFAVRDARLYIDQSERAAERLRQGIADKEFVIVIVGGWWPAKDINTVLSALADVGPCIRVLIAGFPIDPSRLSQVAYRLRDQLVVLEQPLTRADLRAVYSIADVSVVSRHSGVVKESGLVLDGIRYGVHIVVSNNDSTLNSKLAAVDYATLYRCGDSEELAGILDRLSRSGAPRPHPGAAKEFGLLSADEALDAYRSSYSMP